MLLLNITVRMPMVSFPGRYKRFAISFIKKVKVKGVMSRI